MRTYALICSLFLLFSLKTAYAGELRVIELSDGSVVTGEVLSLESGIYTVRSGTLGTIRIEEAKIRAIRTKTAETGAGAASTESSSAAEINALQTRMMSDQEVMGLIQALGNDPEFQKILEDPAIVKAVNDGDVSVLMADPRFLQLLNNPTVREIQKKVQ
jgi:hypothetical protein